jgi:ATP adenylyltransferase
VEYFFNFDKLAYVKGKRPEGCILCHLAASHPDVPDTAVYRDEKTLVAVNLYPYNPGHLMVIPQRHVTDIRQLDAGERLAMDQALDKTLAVLDSLYSPQGYNIGYNMGLAAGASIPHLHMHVIPRYPNEIGIAELIGGKRVLVEDVMKTHERLAEAFKSR